MIIGEERGTFYAVALLGGLLLGALCGALLALGTSAALRGTYSGPAVAALMISSAILSAVAGAAGGIWILRRWYHRQVGSPIPRRRRR